MTDQPHQVEWTANIPVGFPALFASGFAQWSSLGRANIEATLFAVSAFSKSAFAWQGECAAIAGTHMDRTAEHARQLLEVKDSAELLRLQSDFLRQTADDCVQGAHRLLETGATVARDLLQSSRDRAGELIRQGDEAVRETARSVDQPGDAGGVRVHSVAS